MYLFLRKVPRSRTFSQVATLTTAARRKARFQQFLVDGAKADKNACAVHKTLDLEVGSDHSTKTARLDLVVTVYACDCGNMDLVTRKY
jgi:hypothetical protein